MPKFLADLTDEEKKSPKLLGQMRGYLKEFKLKKSPDLEKIKDKVTETVEEMESLQPKLEKKTSKKGGKKK